jgi:hypothetical protein
MNLFSNKSEDYLPWIQRPSSWVVIVIVLLSLSALYIATEAYFWTAKQLETEVVTAKVVHYETILQSYVDKYSVVRKYGRRNLPACSWDSSEETICDEWKIECIRWKTECVRRDSTGCLVTEKVCTEERKVRCIESHIEYDYSIYDWKSFSTEKKVFWDQRPNKKHLDEFGDRSKWKVKTDTFYYVHITKDGQTARFSVKVIDFNQSYVKIVRRKLSKKPLKILNQ